MIRRIFLVSSALAIGGVLAACSDSGNKQGAAGAAGAAAAQQAAPVGVISLAAAICAAGVAECGATDKAPAALAINAPTMITDEIALVTLINGV